MRIYDTFLFDGELDLLEHRLAEAYDFVDLFVLVEAAQTFRGEPKALTFRDNQARFAWASAKIRPIALRTLGPNAASAWNREAFQRNTIMLGLRDADPEDVVLILDADEIPSVAFLRELRANGLDRPHRLAMTRHYEYLDLVAPRSACCPDPAAPFPFDLGHPKPQAWPAPGARWQEHTAIATRFRDLAGDPQSALPPRSAYELRRLMHKAPRLPDAGRHFVSADPAARLGRKLARVSHAELSDRRSLDADHLRRARRYGVHHHGWWYAERPAGDLPDDLQRLASRAPQMQRPEPLPSPLSRRLARTWAWLRFGPRLPEGLVSAVDRHFERLMPVLAPVLLAADFARYLGARFGWRWLRLVTTEVPSHPHHHG